MLNSDNINVTGESFDYGPWRFTPYWDPDFTAAYFDHYGLYAFGRQPEAIHWDLAQFAGCLSLVARSPELSPKCSRNGAKGVEQALVRAMLRRLGIPAARRMTARSSPRSSARWRHASISIDRIFFDWRGGYDPGIERYPAQAFRDLSKLLDGRRSPQISHYWSDPSPVRCTSKRSRRFGRRLPIADDWQPFDNKVKAIRRMGEAMGQDAPQG